MHPAALILQVAAGLLLSASMGYWIVAWLSMRGWRPQLADQPMGPALDAADWLPVTLLKPLHGTEPGLEENLRSFCEQDYPQYEVLCGVQDAGDPAISVVETLQQNHPEYPLRLIVHDTHLGQNPKIDNLAGLLAQSRNPVLVLSDADIRVGRDYLRSLASGLEVPGAGVVTCLYRARIHGGFWSQLLAAQIQEGFLPSVLLAARLGPQIYCAGATIALHRSLLESWGGFAAMGDILADDFFIGAKARELGLSVMLSGYVVDTAVQEPGFRDFYAHSLRWARTTRAVRPGGYALSFITFPLPLAVLCGPLLGWQGWFLVGLVLVFRVMYHNAIVRKLKSPVPLAAAVLADFFGIWIWGHAQLAGRVSWRGRSFSIDAQGRMRNGVKR